MLTLTVLIFATSFLRSSYARSQLDSFVLNGVNSPGDDLFDLSSAGSPLSTINLDDNLFTDENAGTELNLNDHSVALGSSDPDLIAFDPFSDLSTSQDNDLVPKYTDSSDGANAACPAIQKGKFRRQRSDQSCSSSASESLTFPSLDTLVLPAKKEDEVPIYGVVMDLYNSLRISETRDDEKCRNNPLFVGHIVPVACDGQASFWFSIGVNFRRIYNYIENCVFGTSKLHALTEVADLISDD